MTFPLLTDQTNLHGKRVLVRLDLNVPMRAAAGGGMEVADNFRIRKAIPTLAFLREWGAKIVVISHIGRKPEDSLAPVAPRLQELLGVKVRLVETFGEARTATAGMRGGEVVLLENLRRWEGEEKNDPEFAKSLASLGDIFVNDAFSVSHREHASLVGVPKFLPSCAGRQFAEEVRHLSLAFSPDHPFLFILGGAKFETKIPLLKRFEDLADAVFVGGALGNEILRARGEPIGRSVVEEPIPEYVADLARNAKLIPILDAVVISGQETETKHRIKQIKNIAPDEAIVDAGPETVKKLCESINQAHFILMNGPLGWYEKGFDAATGEVLKAIARSRAVSILGGGDTAAMVDKMRLERHFSFVSTAGGAMLDFLADGKLPGITALEGSGK